MGWIVRLINKETITEKKFLSEGKKFQHLPHKLVKSIQILFAGNFVTITRANDTQRLCQLKVHRTTSGSDLLPEGHPLKSKDNIITLIFCVYNNKGDVTGWEINYETNKIKPFTDNVFSMGLRFEDFNIHLDSIIDDYPDLFIYTMRRDNVEFTI